MADSYVYSVATGILNPWKKKSRQAAEIMSQQDGFVAAYAAGPHGMFWFYDSLNNAKGARNIAMSKGIQCGTNICRFRNEGNEYIFGDPDFDEEMKKNGRKEE